jgi:hypothetical protein
MFKRGRDSASLKLAFRELHYGKKTACWVHSATQDPTGSNSIFTPTPIYCGNIVTS